MSRVETDQHQHQHQHEQQQEGQVWERWQKERLFVRELRGLYGEVYKKVLNQPRVIKSKEMPWKGGPGLFGRKVINPQRLEITQMIEAHLDVYAPASHGQKHGHMNSAVFYVLEGRGYDVHDTVRYDWEAGDVCIVNNASVHQHFNADPEKPAKVLIMKAKPLFLFAHMIYQKVVEYPPKDPVPGFEDFRPEED